MYEYRCEKCGKDLEILQKFSDPPATAHEDCGGSLVKKLALGGFALKGSGWYTTDYKKSGSSMSSSSTVAPATPKGSGESCGSDGSGACGSGACSAN